MSLRIFHSFRLMVPVLVTVAVLPSLLALLYSGFEAQNEVKRDAEQDILRLAIRMAVIQERITASTQVMLSSLTLVPSVNQLDLPACNDLFKKIVRLNPIYTNILMADRNGDVIASAIPFEPINLADRKHFKDAYLSKKFSTGEYIVSRSSFKPAFPFSYPLLDEKGQIKAILIAAIELEQYKEYFSGETLPDGSFFGIADHDGRRLFRIPKSGDVFDLGKPISPLVWDIVKTGVNDGVMHKEGSDKIRRIIAYSKLHLGTETPAYMSMFVGVPEKILINNASAAMFKNAVFAGGSWLLALLLFWLIGRNLFFEKIKRLTDCASQFGSGNLNMLTGVDHKAGELGQVAEAFDQMAVKLRQADIERDKLQQQLIQAQKLEAIGTLAGGIAHDFNNILGAMIGFTELARESSPDGSAIAKDLDKVLESGERAAGLVKQILAYSRQTVIEHAPLEPALIIREAAGLLHSTLPATIAIQADIHSDTPRIVADPTQFHQIIMNLCTNAFHAMEQTGGILEISLTERTCQPREVQDHPASVAGRFVVLRVRDTGPGINPEILNRIYDPYFTTKEVGKGTGMGLAIVQAIVHDAGGFIRCESEAGQGTTFEVFFPAAVGQKGAPIIAPSNEGDIRGNERLLLIDDEPSLVEIGQNMLERLGYTVQVCTSSLEALSLFEAHPLDFDAVITDQTMPGMTGLELAGRMLRVRPDLPIILCTGYSSQINEELVRSSGIKGFLMKPLNKASLATTLRRTLAKET
jgi:signal transduction histidine kinase/ActR/RegA family two-component response regulator